MRKKAPDSASKSSDAHPVVSGKDASQQRPHFGVVARVMLGEHHTEPAMVSLARCLPALAYWAAQFAGAIAAALFLQVAFGQVSARAETTRSTSPAATGKRS
jgi:hypothetical protein